MDLSRFPRTSLGHFPTPFEPMNALARALDGPQLYIKRDDCTGLAFGGNKTRKLEFLVADALAQGADTLVTAGGIQSNHVRQTAAAARRAGLDCVALLEEPAFPPDPSFYTSGNQLLDDVFGCQYIYHAAGEMDMNTAAEAHCDLLRSQGKTPHFVPIGGSSAIGALGYVSAAQELRAQTNAMGIALDHIILGTGSAGTHAGLLMGLRAINWDITVTGIAVSATAPEKINAVYNLCVQLADLLGDASAPEKDTIRVSDDYVGPGYGQPTEQTIEAINLTAQHEAILLDPVYTGKAMAGLINMVRTKQISHDETALFLHTGGAPGLFAYPNLFLEPQRMKLNDTATHSLSDGPS